MTVYKIEKNVPPPKDALSSRGQPSEFPWGDLAVGDSFAVPPEKEQKAAMSMRNWNNKHKPKKLASRLEPDGGRRFWRLA